MRNHPHPIFSKPSRLTVVVHRKAVATWRCRMPFDECPRSRVAKETEFVRHDTYSSWACLPEQVAGLALHAIDGATAAKPEGSVVFGKESKTMPNKPMQMRKMRSKEQPPPGRWDAAAMAHCPGLPSTRAATFARPDQLHHPGGGQCGRGRSCRIRAR